MVQLLIIFLKLIDYFKKPKLKNFTDAVLQFLECIHKRDDNIPEVQYFSLKPMKLVLPTRMDYENHLEL